MIENNTTTPELVEHQAELQSEVSAVVAVQIAVTNQETYVKANEQIGKLQAVRKAIVERFSDPKKKAAEAHKSICALEKEFLNPVDQQISNFKRATERWYLAEQNRIRAEEERKRKEAEEAARLAAEAESAGEEEMAQEAVVEATLAQANVTAMPKVSGTTMREVWKAEVTDINAVPREYMIVNQAALDKIAQTMKGQLNIPGVRFVKSYVNSTRAKA